MKKTGLLLLAFTLFASFLSAKQRSSTEAQQIAVSFLSQKSSESGMQKAKLNANSVQLLMQKSSKTDPSKELYYVFGVPQTEGFVIVSANEHAYDILGYSDANRFDPQNMPENLVTWLSFYEQELNTIQDNEVSTQTFQKTPSSNNATQFAANLSPLLGNIKWNQMEPYNNLCPIVPGTSTRAAAGCVATAMAQIMKYYEWPNAATGSFAYTTSTYGISLSANFAALDINWAKLTDRYNSSSTQTEKDAIAALIYNCGVAVKMDYGPSSGAYTHDIATALINYFGYDENIQIWERNFYTQSEWIHLIKTELNENRPVIYGGYSPTSGHQFICDGYDENDFFHFNWGWGGTSDGYFRISALNPTDQGAGSSAGGYNMSQQILTGIQKPISATLPIMNQLHMQGELTSPSGSILRTNNFNIGITSIFNKGLNTLSGFSLGVALFDGNNEFVEIISSNSLATLAPNYGYSSYNYTVSGIPTSITPGNYKLHIVYRANSSVPWEKVRSLIGTPSFLNANISETHISFSVPTNESPNLELQSLTVIGNLYYSKTGRINATIKNNGKEYNSDLGVILQSISDPQNYTFIQTQHTNIAENESINIALNGNINIAPGQYLLQVVQNSTNNSLDMSYVSLGDAQTVTVLPTPTGSSNLQLTSKITFGNGEIIHPGYNILSTSLTNSGSLHDGRVIAFLFPKNGGSSLSYIGLQNIIVDQGETIQLNFGGNIDLPSDEYMVAVYYENGSSWTQLAPSGLGVIIFTMDQTPTAIQAIVSDSDLSVYPVPAKNYIHVKAKNKLLSLDVYDFTGKQMMHKPNLNDNQVQLNLETLPMGNYVIKINTTEGMAVRHFIKK